MASEVIKLNLIPKGEKPVFHASQFDTGRLITCELYRGEDAYSVPEGYTVELHCRKVDNKIVTMASTLINDNVVTFTSTEQLTACNGNNLCEVAILDDGYRIGTLNFILEVEVDPLKGGINSTSEIHNLETQIEEITTEIVGENYYNKTEVDDLLDTKADASSVYTKTQVDSALALKANAADVYTKTQVDSALALKANAADVYTKSQTDDLLDAKANASDVYTKTQTDTLLDAKANASDVYTKTEVDNIILDIMPVDTATGPIATFNTELAVPLVNVSCDVMATGGYDADTQTAHPINGYTEANITANGNTYAIAFGQTVYGGVLDVTRGKLSVDTFGFVADNSLVVSREGASGGVTVFKIVFANNDFPSGVDSTCVSSHFSRSIPSGTSGRLSQTTSEIWGAIDTSLLPTDDSAGVKAWLSTNAVTFYYEITPFDIDLTPEVVSAIVGANSVSSDTGAVTVRFKTTIEDYINNRINRANTNRSLLSSVNSDIIKEKSEIKDQSDIIEDIERGEENE